MTKVEQVYFFHGLESGPVGTKSLALEEHFQVESPDFQGMDIWERLEKADEVTKGQRDLVVVGSSYGGLLTALLYDRRPERFWGYVLMAPALHLEAAEQLEAMAPPERAEVIHGVDDEVVPLEAVKEVCEGFGLGIKEVQDNHRLHGSLEAMVEATESLVVARSER